MAWPVASVAEAEARARRSRSELRYRLRRLRYRLSVPPFPVAAVSAAAALGFTLGRVTGAGPLAWALATALLRRAVQSAPRASTPTAGPTTRAA